MLQLLTPYLLWALTGLLVPVLIHLWNKKQPKVIKVGSIRWLQTAASQQARRLQVHNWPLLLWRCLLLVVLVLFLCQPVWQRLLRQPGQKYVWVAPALLQPQTLPLVEATIDSLLKKNYQLREFALGFPSMPAELWQNLKTGKVQALKPERNVNYWALARAVHQQFPRAEEHLILTDNQLNHFAGERPVLTNASRWLTIPVTPPDSLFVQDIFSKNPDSLTVVVGQGNSSATGFAKYSFPTPAPGQTVTLSGLPAFVYAIKANQAFISLQNSSDLVLVNLRKKNIILAYDKNREPDVRYLSAALSAVSNYTGRVINLSLLPANQNIRVTDTDWLFWLSDQPLPAFLQKEINNGLVILKDALPAPKSGVANYINLTQVPENIPLMQQANIFPEAGSSVWQNNFGEPVLAYKAMGRGGLYTFGSRFNSQWNNLPESSFFPELLSNLIFPATKIRRDYRELDYDQVQPIVSQEKQPQFFRSRVQHNLKYLFLALGALIFLIERYWAFRNGRSQV